MIDTTATTKANFIIAQNQRLSESLLWHWQRTFFAQQGVGAWRGGIVPHHIELDEGSGRFSHHFLQIFLED